MRSIAVRINNADSVVIATKPMGKREQVVISGNPLYEVVSGNPICAEANRSAPFDCLKQGLTF